MIKAGTFILLYITGLRMLLVQAVPLKLRPAGGGVAGEGHVGQVGLLDVSEGLLPVSGEALVELTAGTSAEPVKGGLWVLPEVFVDHHLVFANWNSDGSVFCGCERQIYLPLNPLPIIFYCRSTG